MSVMKIAGKTANNLVKGIAVETDGRVMTSKKWEADKLTVLEAEGITTADAVTNLSNITDLSGYGIVSLRVNYKMPGAALRIGLYTDLTDSGSSYMYDKNNEYACIDLPASASSTLVILTPDDFPYLPYLRYLKVRARATDTPTAEGFVKIYAIVKR